MKKANKLLFAVVAVALMSSFLAARARVNHVIYIQSPTSPPGVCNFAVIGRSFIPDFSGNVFATLVANGVCQKGRTIEVPN